MTEKATFAPLPARAIGDTRLTGLHLRVLAAVALHDRLSGSRGKGQGCWAGNKKLATICACNYTNLSTALTDLGRYGYIVRELHPLNRRLRIFRVCYLDADTLVAKSTNDANVGDSLPTGKDEFAQAAVIVCPQNFKSESDQSVRNVEYIGLKPLTHSAKSIRINPVETAPLRGGTFEKVRNVGGLLAQLERAIKNGNEFDVGEWTGWLSEVMLDENQTDANRYVAERILMILDEPRAIA